MKVAIENNLIYPSTLGLSPTELISSVEQLVTVGATTIHIDVMDGTLSNEIYDGLEACKQLQASSTFKNISFDIHVVELNPEGSLQKALQYHGSRVSLHCESKIDIPQALARLRKAGIRAGIAFLYDTEISPDYIKQLTPDFIHLVTTDSKGAFGASSERRIAGVRHTFPELEITCDGGVKLDKVEKCVQSGANYLVAGSAVFGNSEAVHDYLALNSCALSAQPRSKAQMSFA